MEKEPAVQPDRIGMLLLGAAFATAPLEIWSLATVASHGITLAHIVAILFTTLGVVRIRRMPLPAAFALYCLVALLVWGVIIAFLQARGIPSLPRTVRVAILFVLMFGAFAGASTVRLNLSRGGLGMRIGTWAYALVVFYAVYQAFARRLGLPFAFLRVTNPSYSTDPFQHGFQHGIHAAQMGWGDYFLRASATFSEPSHLGRYLAYGFAISLALIALGGKRVRYGVFGLVLATAGLIANYSLNGVLSYGVVLLAMALPLLRQVRFAILMRLGAVVTLLVGAILVWAPSIHLHVFERLSTLSVSQSSGRFSALPLVWSVVKEKPWGAGLAGVSFGNEIHNGFMLFAVQFGVVGALVPVVWMLTVAFGVLLLLVRERRIPPVSRAALTLSVGFIAAQLAGWVGGSGMHFSFAWIMSGVAFGTLGRVLKESHAVDAVRRPTSGSRVTLEQKVSTA